MKKPKRKAKVVRAGWIYPRLVKLAKELDSIAAEVSYMETIFCIKSGGHIWRPEKPSKTTDMPMEECERCGCSRVIVKVKK